MKRSIPIIILCLCPILAIAKGFTIQGSVSGLRIAKVSLAYRTVSGDDTTITTLMADGRFALAGIVAEPQLVRLAISDGWAYNTNFFLENADISISLTKDAGEKTIITGCRSDATYQKLKPGLNDFFAHARENKEAHELAATNHDSHLAIRADSLWAAQHRRWVSDIQAAIAADHDNYAALYFIQWLLFKPDFLDSIRAVYIQLSSTVRQGMAGRKFMTDFDHLYRTSIGQTAPDITGRDTSDRAVSLAEMRGKVILLDFWSSYCGPCRQENKRLQTVYQKYHQEGFEIVSFSLDNERRLWLNAILADGLIWPQASDLRGGAGATAAVYDISELPRNVLIDRSGRIYARDIHGDDLIRSVEVLLKKVK